jgi:hypothetical protein
MQQAGKQRALAPALQIEYTFVGCTLMSCSVMHAAARADNAFADSFVLSARFPVLC